uniref:Tr-type G domain-containing protein n=1 Tax=Timspurckia oligopyrenoides TaxID=708627 RepID=A0A7S0ZJC9_9RHOD|mmetsp:Transcript_6873/g.12296  ORF Transcript_6873/g.12296 Transcript_6873/m.12296 type:complete len:598 (+) Transcript_6873:104-1897(+)|eukprot:CAMPEP_0182448164 /NCGR_PEP_ID=MMETSP1172-20130603/24384_1 /TAXON_ID=708627 /ORGANISM="Timspurckia oligopyrenoides, Strain CCMP3278" /LENGTH=597 /DNA_ID=CAMNT_0024644927 /DNA_START=56 /DNA_END=1849 /DNA_ORIENTATION=-
MNPGANEYVPSWFKGDVSDSKQTASSSSQQSSSSSDPPPKLSVSLPPPRKIVLTTTTPSSNTSQKPNQQQAQTAPPSQSSTQENAEKPDAVVSEIAKVSIDEQQASTNKTKDEKPSESAAASAANGSSSKIEQSAKSDAVDDELENEMEQGPGDSIANLLDQSDGRKTVNLVFIGHVDAGKSTISGHLLYLTGNVDERTMEKFEREAKAKNRESWKYAWALDLTDNERDKGKTEECGRASFTTESRRFVLLDAPGHKSFVPHMIGGASQADVGMLVISARKGEFETGFERGGQTREHAMLAKTSGVRQLVVIINKMDDPSIVNPDGSWSKERYDECVKKLWPFLASVGWKQGDVSWIPASGLTGMNLKHVPDKSICPWYEGESLIDTLDHLKPPERLVSAPVKLPIFEKYKEMGGLQLLGKLEAGRITLNDKLVLMPNKSEFVVDGIALEENDTSVAEPGDNVRLRVKGIEEEDVRPGFVACSPDNLVSVASVFDVRLMILEHKSIITAGYSAVMHIHAAVEECTIETLIGKIDKKTGKLEKTFPKFAKPGTTVVARIRMAQSICVEDFKSFPQLGRFMIRDEGRTIGVGVVLKVRE